LRGFVVCHGSGGFSLRMLEREVRGVGTALEIFEER